MSDASDDSLVKIVRGKGPMTERQAALDELSRRCRPAFHKLRSRMKLGPVFLSRVRVNFIEDLEGEVVGRALLTFKPDQDARFSSYAGTIYHNHVVGVLRGRPAFQSATDADGDDRLGRHAAPSEQSLEKDILDRAAALTQRCLKLLSARHRDVFIWAVLLECTPTMLHEVFPDISFSNFKQLSHRARAAFATAWSAGGGDALLHMAAEVRQAMVEHADLDRIKDPKARRAVQLWHAEKSLSAVAKRLNLTPAEAQSLVAGALRELAQASFRRGGKLAPLAEYLEFAEDRALKDELTARVDRSVALARAAFGFGPIAAAVDTLGSFCQRQFATADDYERAIKALEITPARLRRLLADEDDFDAALLTRLAKFLGIPRRELAALPRRAFQQPLLMMRAPEPYDQERFRSRVWACLKKR
jgi:DNA-directed RNA polymerase specialized sigma24 family protein